LAIGFFFGLSLAKFLFLRFAFCNGALFSSFLFRFLARLFSGGLFGSETVGSFLVSLAFQESLTFGFFLRGCIVGRLLHDDCCWLRFASWLFLRLAFCDRTFVSGFLVG
jgi:hypothetical protein